MLKKLEIYLENPIFLLGLNMMLNSKFVKSWNLKQSCFLKYYSNIALYKG
uniref:Alternative protein RBM8A n=1 Tax=Homo sapiens TaxID=9606 RepID=L8E9A7_HUMAN|nr:alternative protein RBM8A [Homo sapiens]